MENGKNKNKNKNKKLFEENEWKKKKKIWWIVQVEKIMRLSLQLELRKKYAELYFTSV